VSRSRMGPASGVPRMTLAKRPGTRKKMKEPAVRRPMRIMITCQGAVIIAR
jgi:hypothetical protein